MTHLQKAIEDAVKGGYLEEKNRETGKLSLRWNLGMMVQSEILLDPLFWQCLCRSWTDMRGEVAWKYYWHSLIDHLASGGTPESFFTSLDD